MSHCVDSEQWGIDVGQAGTNWKKRIVSLCRAQAVLIAAVKLLVVRLQWQARQF